MPVSNRTWFFANRITLWASFINIIITARVHRAVLPIVPVVPFEGAPPPVAPDQLPFLPMHVEQTFVVGLDVTKTKKGRQLFRERKVHSRENSGYAYEKRARLTLVCPPPRMVNPALRVQATFLVTVKNFISDLIVPRARFPIGREILAIRPRLRLFLGLFSQDLIL